MKGKDLGTYHVKVEFENERGYIQEYSTGLRFTHGDDSVSPLTATMMVPIWESEEELIHCIVFSYTENNYSCDCNRRLFIARAYQEDEPEDRGCSEDIKLKRLTLIRPDATEEVIWEKK